jgi:acetyl esterase/lipase
MLELSYRNGERGDLDIYTPRRSAGRATKAPVIVFFYGGRWQSGDRRWYRPLAATLAARGYVVVVPDYRLYPSARFPDFLEDGAKAIRWTRDHIADHGGDPGSIFVMGHSAGAYIAAMLACDSTWLSREGLDPAADLSGLIGLAGPYDFLPLTDNVLIDIFGGADRIHTQPIAFASGPKPPALFLTGSIDGVVDAGNSIRMAAALRRFGNAAQDIPYRRLGHFSILAGIAPVLWRALPLQRDIDAFVARAGATLRRRAVMRAGVPAE